MKKYISSIKNLVPALVGIVAIFIFRILSNKLVEISANTYKSEYMLINIFAKGVLFFILGGVYYFAVKNLKGKKESITFSLSVNIILILIIFILFYFKYTVSFEILGFLVTYLGMSTALLVDHKKEKF